MTEPTNSQSFGPKVLLEGPSGTGKTYAIGPLVDWAQANEYEVFVLFTENGLETLLGYWKDPLPGKPAREIPKCLHWHSTMTKPLSLARIMEGADKVGLLSYEALTKSVDPNRGGANNAFLKILSACSNFPDDRTGEKFGAVDTWGIKRIFVIDSLSELCNAAFKMVIGNRPTASPPDYGVAQNNLMNFLRLCTQGIPCPFLLTAHVSREKDEVTGGVKLMTKAIGAAISGEIPQLFSDVIFTVREGATFYWDTAAAAVDVKTRNLPIQAKLPPDMGKIMDKWAARGVA